MTGAGCKAEVLPVWVARRHSLSGKDWIAALLQVCKDRGLPWGKGYSLVDLNTGEPMEYEKKMRLTREMYKELDHSSAGKLLNYKGTCSSRKCLP